CTRPWDGYYFDYW
nr:immunoglobulin heavy chain junction region [Mus musculus]